MQQRRYHYIVSTGFCDIGRIYIIALLFPEWLLLRPVPTRIKWRHLWEWPQTAVECSFRWQRWSSPGPVASCPHRPGSTWTFIMTSGHGHTFRITGPLWGNPSVTGGFHVIINPWWDKMIRSPVDSLHKGQVMQHFRVFLVTLKKPLN